MPQNNNNGILSSLWNMNNGIIGQNQTSQDQMPQGHHIQQALQSIFNMGQGGGVPTGNGSQFLGGTPMTGGATYSNVPPMPSTTPDGAPTPQQQVAGKPTTGFGSMVNGALGQGAQWAGNAIGNGAANVGNFMAGLF